MVTGGTGFLGAHCLIQLLMAGYETSATVRDLRRADEVRAMLRRGGAGEVGDRLTLFQADLNANAGWADAVAGCDYVLHVASPFPSTVPKDENELIVPARDGALRVLRAARDAGVKRVVLTSFFAAIGYGAKGTTTPFTEEDWTNLSDPGVQPYQKSKTLAEWAVWDFIKREGSGLELAVVNPVGIFGPVLGPDYSTSILLVKRLLDGSMPGCPDLWYGVVDVRDVADLLLQAIAAPAARGERFLATGRDFVSVLQIAQILKDGAGEGTRKVPARLLPNWLMRVIGMFDRQVSGILPELGKQKNASSEKARRLLGWAPRSPPHENRNRNCEMNPDQQATIEMIESYLQVAIDTVSEPHMVTLDGYQCGTGAPRESPTVPRWHRSPKGTHSAKKEIVNRMIRDIAIREAGRQSPTLDCREYGAN